MLPRAASEHIRAQERLSNVVVESVRRIWRRLRGRTWEQAWRADVGPAMIEVVNEGQMTAAATAGVYMFDVLDELGIDSQVSTVLNTDVFAGVAGDGRPVDSLLYGGVIQAAKAQYRPEMAGVAPSKVEQQALDEAMAWIEQTAQTIMADTVRASEAAAMAQRPWLTGYIRMITPGACSRCVVLAGKFYLHNAGFLRHPACNCIHIPADEDIAHNILTNPNDYFESLSPAEQDRVFTVAGAEAIRLGANIGDVVNARRGMSTAQINKRGWIPKGRLAPVDVFGQQVFITNVGATRRAAWRKSNPGLPVRLMPESILAIAKNPEDAIRLLKLYGYIT